MKAIRLMVFAAAVVISFAAKSFAASPWAVGQTSGTANVPIYFNAPVTFSSGTTISGGSSASPTVVASTITTTADAVRVSTHVIFGANLTMSAMSVVDAYTGSFGAVTAGSTSTVTWTEVTDRVGEFVTSSFTATTAGLYQVTAYAGVSQTAGTACLLIKVGGALVTGGEACNQGVTALASIIPVGVDRILSLAAGDILRIDASATTANATFVKGALTIKRVP